MSGNAQKLRQWHAFAGSADGSRAARLRAYLSAHYAWGLFLVVFLLPTLVAAIYYGLIASDRYISETRFIVRSVSKPAAQGAAAYLQDFGILRANDDAFAVQDYIHSRDAMHLLMRRINLRKVWSHKGVDFWSRYGSMIFADSDEALFRHYQRQIAIDKDLESGITTVKVSAYRAKEAQAIAQFILDLSEAKVNEMNLRARRDSLAVAGQAVESAARRLAQATVSLSRVRDNTRLIDPAQTAAATVKRSSVLDQELARLQVTLQTMQTRAPDNPSIPALRQRIAALSGQVQAQQGQLTGAQDSLSGKVGDFEKLEVELRLAEKTYEAAQNQFDSAREEAQRQQVYIESIARPNLADEPQEPRRLRYAFTVALLAFWSFLIFYLLVSGSREHLNLS